MPPASPRSGMSDCAAKRRSRTRGPGGDTRGRCSSRSSRLTGVSSGLGGVRKCNFDGDTRQEEVVAQECDLILFDDRVGGWVSAAWPVRQTERVFQKGPAPTHNRRSTTWPACTCSRFFVTTSVCADTEDAKSSTGGKTDIRTAI